MKQKNSLMYILKRAGGKYLLAAQILLSGYLAYITIYVSRLAQNAIDSRSIMQNFKGTAVQFLLIGTSGIAASFLILYIRNLYAVKMTKLLKNQCLESLLECKYENIENTHSGTIIRKLTNDVQTCSEYSAYGMPEFIKSTIIFIISFVYLLLTNWTMTLICAISVPLAGFITAKFANPTYQTMDEFSKRMDSIAATAKDSVMSAKVEKAYNLQTVRQKEFNSKMDEATKIYVSFEKLMAISGAYKYLLRAGPVFICILAGFISSYYGMITSGKFAAFIILLQNITNPLSCFIGYITEYKEAQVSMDRIKDVLEFSKEKSGAIQKINKTDSEECFSLKDVSFNYKTKKALSNITCSIKKGQTTALVGKSGSGKSTLFKILSGFYRAEEGKVLFFGTDISSISLETLRSQIAYVEQNTFLFDKTVAENIACNITNQSLDMDKIIDAAKKAYAHDFIMKLPQGYDTVLSENGETLSGGQRQRIAIARAILKNAPVMLLDEMTSALDVESEKLIQQAISEYRKSNTVIVAAHRLSTIENADNILVLNEGRIVEQGTHKSLLANNGIYASIYKSDDMPEA